MLTLFVIALGNEEFLTVLVMLALEAALEGNTAFERVKLLAVNPIVDDDGGGGGGGWGGAVDKFF